MYVFIAQSLSFLGLFLWGFEQRFSSVACCWDLLMVSREGRKTRKQFSLFWLSTFPCLVIGPFSISPGLCPENSRDFWLGFSSFRQPPPALPPVTLSMEENKRGIKLVLLHLANYLASLWTWGFHILGFCIRGFNNQAPLVGELADVKPRIPKSNCVIVRGRFKWGICASAGFGIPAGSWNKCSEGGLHYVSKWWKASSLFSSELVVRGYCNR